MVTRVNGSVGTEDGGIYSPGASTAFYIINVADATDTAVDLRAESESGEAIEAVVREVPSVIAYDIANADTGIIYIITDGHAALSSNALQDNIRALGTNVGPNGIDVSGTVVQPGAGFSISTIGV